MYNYTNCVSLKSICVSLNVKLCEKGTRGGVRREERMGDDEEKKRE